MVSNGWLDYPELFLINSYIHERPQNDFHLKSSFDKTKYIFDQSIWECNGHFDHWFSNTKSFLCGIWNLCRERLDSSGSSDLVLHSSINRCVVNGRDAMAAHSRDIYLFFHE